MDSGLLGEHILQTIAHAWDELLLPQTITSHDLILRVIPHRAEVFIAPIESIYIAKKNRVLISEKDPNLSSVFIGLKEFTLYAERNEPYDCENLRRIPGSFTLLAEAKEGLCFNFNDYQSLKTFLGTEGVSRKLNFECSFTGFVDAVALWFQIDLDEEISLSSSPLLRDYADCCWDQTIFPLKESVHLKVGETIEIELSCKEGAVQATVLPVSKRNQKSEEMPLSEDSVRYLNDGIQIKALDSLKNSCLEKRTNPQILIWSPFPYLGLICLKAMQCKFTWFGQHECDLKFIQKLLERDKISKALADCLIDKNFKNYCSENCNTYDVIYVSLFNTSGGINEEVVQNIPLIKSLLNPGGIIIPNKFTVWCQIVQSEWLVRCMEVRNAELDKAFKLSEFINEYKALHFIDLDLRTASFTALSAELPVAKIDLDLLVSDDILSVSYETEIKYSGTANAIIFWYSYELGSSNISTRDEDSYINQSAQILESELKVEVDDKVNVSVLINENFIHFRMDLGDR